MVGNVHVLASVDRPEACEGSEAEVHMEFHGYYQEWMRVTALHEIRRAVGKRGANWCSDSIRKLAFDQQHFALSLNYARHRDVQRSVRRASRHQLGWHSDQGTPAPVAICLLWLTIPRGVRETHPGYVPCFEGVHNLIRIIGAKYRQGGQADQCYRQRPCCRSAQGYDTSYTMVGDTGHHRRVSRSKRRLRSYLGCR